jgi:hypothetical protein
LGNFLLRKTRQTLGRFQPFALFSGTNISTFFLLLNYLLNCCMIPVYLHCLVNIRNGINQC